MNYYYPPAVLVENEIHVPTGGVCLIGRDPGEQEVETGRPFVGLAGQLLDIVLSYCSFRREDVNILNVVRQRPSNNDFRQHKQEVVDEALDYLHHLLLRLRPKLIITMGNEAAFAVVPEWPTNGRGIYGAKGIEDRRGYMWESRYGKVLTTLHPAGVLRNPVPGDYLLRQDFKKARRWLTGALPDDTFPDLKRLTSAAATNTLLKSSLVAWDIENKWQSTALLCSGYCGDDYQPYVANAGSEFDTFGKTILTQPVPKVGHNGNAHDVPAMELLEGIQVVNYVHDTQQMWWALEPDLAGSDAETDEEGTKGTARMTRKGLAFLASLYFNLPWWKNYPEGTDPDFLDKMIVLNSRDAFVTKWLADCLLVEVHENGVLGQYETAISLYPATTRMLLRGLNVDLALQESRQKLLTTRHTELKEQAEKVGLDYIIAHDITAFAEQKKCDCCGGGKTQAQKCWRCSGLPMQPKRKGDWPTPWIEMVQMELGVKKPTIGDLRELLKPCQRCLNGKVTEYHFNPYSNDQLKTLLYDTLGVPKSVWKGKETMDASALQKILRWAKGK